MMFDNGSLLVGTDEGRIKVFKEGPVVTQRINNDFVTKTPNIIFSRIGTKDGDDYVIDDYNMGGDLWAIWAIWAVAEVMIAVAVGPLL